MERPSTLFICGAIALTLIALGYLLGYISLSEQTQKLTQLETQTQVIFDNQMGLYEDLAKLDSALEALKTARRGEIEGILSKIEGITEKIQDWRNEYNTFLGSIRKGIDTLTSVDLGEVEVEGGRK